MMSLPSCPGRTARCPLFPVCDWLLEGERGCCGEAARGMAAPAVDVRRAGAGMRCRLRRSQLRSVSPESRGSVSTRAGRLLSLRVLKFPVLRWFHAPLPSRLQRRAPDRVFRALARVSVTRLEARSGPWTPTSTGPGACLPDRPTNDQSVTTLFARSDHLLGDLFSRKPSRPLRWRPCGRFDALSVLGAAAHRPGGARTRDRHRARTRGGDEHTPRGDAGGAVPGQGGAGLAHDWSVLAPLPSALLGRQGVDRDEKPRPDTQHPARPDALGGAVARPVRRARSRFLHRPPASRRRLRRAQACVVVEQPPVEPRHRLESDPAAARHCAE